MEIANKPLVMASEITGLEPLCGYIKQLNKVIPARFALVKRRRLQPEFIERKMPKPKPSQRLEVQPELPPVEISAAKALPAAVPAAPEPAVRKPKPVAAATVSVPASPKPLPLFPEQSEKKPVQAEPRRSAFKKKPGTDEEKPREWKPVD